MRNTTVEVACGATLLGLGYAIISEFPSTPHWWSEVRQEAPPTSHEIFGSGSASTVTAAFFTAPGKPIYQQMTVIDNPVAGAAALKLIDCATLSYTGCWQQPHRASS